MPIFFFVVLLVMMDQLSKFFVVSFLKGQSPYILIDGFLSFYYIENRGAAFGILQNSQLLFSIITIVVLLGLMIYLIKNYKSSSLATKISLTLIIAGAIGNFIDRLRLKYVIDFISFRMFGHDFAVFNLADSFIVIGTIIVMILVILHENPKRKKNE
ncbi:MULTISPECIES: signal peptidase II [Peptoniphilus]|uniref:signal peptidase II n=1 Tax=Peptoniphilus TaxID=162289 RepID=UPI0003B8E642|nr:MULTISPECIES: signal peptidase II [Peptoniphilus]ERT63316.1 signal peptidase II [Peptoniphilus sp. BV3AC2]MDK8275928.1 signal peptidase II [Peptoniphilus duerdenii]